MPRVMLRCPICEKDHSGYIAEHSAIKVFDLVCSTKCYEQLKLLLAKIYPTKETITAPVADHRGGAQCKNYNSTGGTCRCGVRADQNAHHAAFRDGVVRGNVCPVEGDWHEAETFCEEYE